MIMTVANVALVTDTFICTRVADNRGLQDINTIKPFNCAYLYIVQFAAKFKLLKWVVIFGVLFR